MAKITSVESQNPPSLKLQRTRKNLHRFNIFLDGEFAFGADEDLVVRRRLVVGKIIDDSDLEKILFEAEVGKLMERLYRWFGLRERSEKETRDYLKIKSKDLISPLVISATIELLKQKEILNDERFAKAWVQSRRNFKKKGKVAIKGELISKGINKEIIEQVISSELVVRSDEEIATEALAKKINVWKNLEDLEFKKKAYGYLGRKGFEFEAIKKVVEKVLKRE